MAINNVSPFLQKDWARRQPNMFLVDVKFPHSTKGSEQELINVMCKSAALPGSNLGVIEFLSEEEQLRSQVTDLRYLDCNLLQR